MLTAIIITTITSLTAIIMNYQNNKTKEKIKRKITIKEVNNDEN